MKRLVSFLRSLFLSILGNPQLDVEIWLSDPTTKLFSIRSLRLLDNGLGVVSHLSRIGEKGGEMFFTINFKKNADTDKIVRFLNRIDDWTKENNRGSAHLDWKTFANRTSLVMCSIPLQSGETTEPTSDFLTPDAGEIGS